MKSVFCSENVFFFDEVTVCIVNLKCKVEGVGIVQRQVTASSERTSPRNDDKNLMSDFFSPEINLLAQYASAHLICRLFDGKWQSTTDDFILSTKTVDISIAKKRWKTIECKYV